MTIIDDRTPQGDLPLPHVDNLQTDDIPRIREALTLIGAYLLANSTAIDGKAASVHTHAMDQVAGLLTALDLKSPVGHGHLLSDLLDVDAPAPTNGQVLKRIGTQWQASKVLLGDVEGWEATVNAQIAGAITGLRSGAPGALDTLDELAAALGDDPNFAASIATALGNRLRLDVAQSLTPAQKTQAQTNLGVSAFIRGLLDDANASEAQATLGISSFIRLLLDDTDAATARQTLGAQAALPYVPARSLSPNINGFTWNPANGSIQFYVDGTYIGEGATQSWCRSVFYNGANIASGMVGVLAALGGIGSIAMLKCIGINAVPGGDYAGANLQWSGTDEISGGAPAGTWRALGRANFLHSTLFVRIA